MPQFLRYLPLLPFGRREWPARETTIDDSLSRFDHTTTPRLASRRHPATEKSLSTRTVDIAH